MRVRSVTHPPSPLRHGWTVQAPGRRARPVHVPGCMQHDLDDRFEQGPVLYRITFDLPDLSAREHVTLHFAGVSFACEVHLNGTPVGAHTGVWDAFTLEVTGHARARANLLEVAVTRPAPLTAGPDSPHRPGPYPLRTTLAGFLPYVWGDIFGGLWQDVWLLRTPAPYPAHLRVDARTDGTVRVSGVPDAAEVRVLDPEQREVLKGRGVLDGRVALPQRWSPAQPRRYTVQVRDGEDTFEQPFAFRALRADGARLLLDGEVVFPRFVLSWGWYPHCLHSNPGPQAFREELLRVRALGFNGVKLCLWVPPDAYFDLADELGLFLWLELPMWLPRLTPEVRQQMRLEDRRILEQLAHHPSVVLVTLGCELNAEADRAFLGELYEDARLRMPEVLLRDNSGGGEAYGGLLDEHAEFYDHHFYCEAPTFGPLLDHFAPRWRPPAPWLFGEFCDSDAFRDARAVGEALGRPWWLSADPQVNPQGARWQMDVHEHETRFSEGALATRAQDLHAASAAHSLLHRKLTLEAVRARGEASGYTITGLVDTPISTSGMFTDTGEARFDAERFRAFNADTVFLCGFTKRRAWVRGGDRAAYTDVFNHLAGGTFRAHVIVAHAGPSAYRATLRVTLRLDGVVLREDHAWAEVGAGDPREVAVFEALLPPVTRPGRLELEVSDGERRNTWAHWLYPPARRPDAHLHDPLGAFGTVDAFPAPPEHPLWVSTLWDDVTRAALHGGHRVLLVQTTPHGPQRTFEDPYWREAVTLLEPHPCWGDFPQDGHPDTQFVAVTPDLSVERPAGAEAIMTRMDARTMRVSSYAHLSRCGAGCLLHTTLRLAGGLGDQPAFARNQVGQQLLARFLTHLHAAGVGEATTAKRGWGA